jgi:hypothetical protein
MTIAHDHADPATTQALSGFSGMVGITFAGDQHEQMMHSSEVASALEWNSPTVSFGAVMASDTIDLSALSFAQPSAAAPSTQAPQAPVQTAEGPAEQQAERQVTRRNDFGLN